MAEDEEHVLTARDEVEQTCRSASLLSVRDDRPLRIVPCGLWSCPIDADMDKSVVTQCIICLQDVNPDSLLPCTTCTQAWCIYCHLKSLAAKQYFCKHVAKREQAGCSFCRTPYSIHQIRQLNLFYRVHRNQLDFLVWAPHPARAGLQESPDQPSELYQCEVLDRMQRMEGTLLDPTASNSTDNQEGTARDADDSYTMKSEADLGTCRSSYSETYRSENITSQPTPTTAQPMHT